MRRISVLITILTFFLIIVGCSGGSGSPTLPDLQNDPGTDSGMSLTESGNEGQVTEPAPETTDETLPVTEENEHPLQGQPLQGSHGLWGLYKFIIDRDADTFEMVPLRAGNLHLNALKFLEPGGEYSMVQLVGGLNWNGDKSILDIDIRIVHPFPTLPKFSGFDVKGILITRGTFGGFTDPDYVMSSIDELHLLNSDGYTRWWNPEEFPGNNIFSYTDGALGMSDSVWDFQSTINGYKYFCDSLSAIEPIESLDQADRGVFRAGSINDRHYTIAVPSFPASLIFNYAIDASWELPTVNPPVTIPDDFPPEANQPEPWGLVPIETINALWNDEPQALQGGYLELEIWVYDWQGGEASPDGSVERIYCEWPGVFDLTEATYDSGQPGYALWTVTLEPLPGALPLCGNDVQYMVFAESVDGDGYGGILDPSEKLTAAGRFTATVGYCEEPNLPPQVSSGVSGNASPGLTLEVYDIVAIDPEGDVLTYSWTVEDTDITDDPGNGDGTIDINWADFGFDNYTVVCLVRDDFNPPVEADILDVLVGNQPPEVGVIEGPTAVDAVDIAAEYSVVASDPDAGQTLTYTWSFEPDGSPENFDDVTDTLMIDFSTVDPGNYIINVQVSDGYIDVPAIPVLVTHSNTAPAVGDVTGLTPVTSLDNDELYQAIWSDPDTTQTLTFLWSVVPVGNPPEFTLPSNPDGSINLDWSTFAVGLWDLNVLADDGIDQTTGVKLSVDKQNTIPTVGDVTGPIEVSSSDTAASYNAEPISDIDPDQSLFALWSVVPFGDPEDFSILAELDLSLIVDWSGYSDGDYEVNIQVEDGIDLVPSTPLVVTKLDNAAPTTGAVSGPTPVYHTTFSADYTCPMNDADGDPLIVFWSVVPNGDPEDFSIPGSEGAPLNVDWSTYLDLGDYDVNCQVDDSLHLPVAGTLLTVSLMNTSPTVGGVTGPSPVDGNDNAAGYSAIVSDPDTSQIMTINWSVVPTGDPPNYVIPDIGGGSVDIDWSGYAVGDYDVNLSVDDGFGPVEGTLLVVSRINTVPEVGPISGSLTVDCTSTNELYASTITDPDTTQIPTILWSVVPTGNPPNYVIPNNGDGSVNINWSVYSVDSYDLNVRVDDGYSVVEGTLVKVTRLNTPPVVGSVNGPTPVTVIDIESYFLDPPTTDCDPGQTFDYMWSIEPMANPPSYAIPTVTGDILVDWSVYGVGAWTIGCEVSDGAENSYATPLNVTVTLEPCEGGAHTYLGTLTPTNYSVAAMSVLPRADISFLEGGIGGINGHGVAQIGPSTLGVFNADSSGATSVPFTYFLGKNDAALSIDTDPIEGRMLVVTALEPNIIKIMDSSIIMGNAIIGTIDSGDPLITWIAIDVEADGDFWAVRRDPNGGVTYELVRFSYLASDPYYVLDPTGTSDITPQTGTNSDIFDIAINHQANMLYLLEAGPIGQGTMQIYMVMPGSPAAFMGTLGSVLFSQPLDYDSDAVTGFAGYADIDVDHADAADERCRILLYGRLADLSSELIRMDATTYLYLDTQNYVDAWPAFAINPDADSGVRNLIMPDTGSLQYWNTPVDW